MEQVRESWHITFADRESRIVYTEAIARNLFTGNYDPNRVSYGTVSTVDYVVTEWFGDHDDPDNPGGWREIYRVSVNPVYLSTGAHCQFCGAEIEPARTMGGGRWGHGDWFAISGRQPTYCLVDGRHAP